MRAREEWFAELEMWKSEVVQIFTKAERAPADTPPAPFLPDYIYIPSRPSPPGAPRLAVAPALAELVLFFWVRASRIALHSN
jgi:hypothetical protein